MLISFLDKISGFLDRRLMVAYWAPAFVGAVLAGAVVVSRLGTERLVDWWTGLGALERLWLGIAALLAITVAAYLLQAATALSVRWYEGYLFPRLLARWGQWGHKQRQQRLRSAFDAARSGGNREDALLRLHQPSDYRSFYLGYPWNPDLVRPTGLGNVLTAAEEHPYELYRLDAILWWPRLMPLVPEAERGQIDAAFTPLLALLNLSTVISVVALGTGAFALFTDDPGWFYVAVPAAGLLLARGCYAAAVGQAEEYATLVRQVFDLHRHLLLKQLRIPAATNLADERYTWEVLNNWLYWHLMPWDNPPPPTVTDAEKAEFPNPGLYPFQFDTPPEPSPKPAAGEQAEGQAR